MNIRLRAYFMCYCRSIISRVSITILLVLIIVVALFFDFTNGFHDTANAMATSIATGALKPKVAVALAGVLNLVGAFLSVAVAKTVAGGIVKLDVFDLNDTVDSERLLLVVFAGLAGGIMWNLFTWLFGIPSSSSHALFGGLIGSAIAAIGFNGVVWGGVLDKIILPALFAPFVAGLIAAIGTWLVYKITANAEQNHRDNYFRWGQIGTASLVALAHGTSDAQKTMGIIAMTLIGAEATGALDDLPFRLDEWRARPDIAEDMLVRHQAACEAAYRAFWQAYGNHAAQTRTREHQRPGLPRQGSNASPVPA